jgi:predicted ATPase with chaperone activity
MPQRPKQDIDVTFSPNGHAPVAAGIWEHVGPAPRTVAESGLPLALLEELALRALRNRDRPRLVELAHTLCLHSHLCDTVMDGLVRRKLATIEAADTPLRAHFRYALTDEGKVAADDAMRRCAYGGAAPVPIDYYARAVQAQAAERVRPSPEQVRASLAHLVLPSETVDAVGQAYASGRPLMVYGPSGNGKTDIVVSVANAIEGTVLVPHALYGQGHIIEVYDGHLHAPVENPEMANADVDRRWREIKRPVAVAGGELTGDALELSYDAIRNVHVAPLSVRSQGGILVIDDLGRQRASLQSILNRWIQLMEKGADSFALQSSEVITLPLDVTLIFSTNIRLRDLMDEAYLRRISYKIPVKNPTADEFRRICEGIAERLELPVSNGALDYLVERLYAIQGIEPKSCYPRDLLQTAVDHATYYGQAPSLDRDVVDRALHLYLGERIDGSPENMTPLRKEKVA